MARVGAERRAFVERWAEVCNMPVVRDLLADLADAEARAERAEEALHRDRTGLAKALGDIVTEVRGRAWVAESRGPYEWDDDRYKAEAGAALRKVHRLAEDALRASGAIVGETLTATRRGKDGE